MKKYLDTRSVEASDDIIENLVAIFIKESTRYFDSPLETATFDKVFLLIAATMLKEKKGTKDLVTDIRN